MTMKTYSGYTIHHANAEDDATPATVWWDGAHIRASSPELLSSLKSYVTDGLDYSAGKEFFEKVPQIFKSGYMYVRKIQVDESGKPV